MFKTSPNPWEWFRPLRPHQLNLLVYALGCNRNKYLIIAMREECY